MADAPTPQFIQARDYTAGGNLPIHRIVIHGTVSPTYCGGADAIARYFQSPTYASSCHYVVDPCSVRQCVNDWDVAWHAPPNAHSIGVELCDPQDGPDSRWDDAEHEAMLDRAAALVRQLCLAYDVPMRWAMPGDLRDGAHGVTDHENVGIAWGQTHHTDPGWSAARSDDFMRRVRGAQPIEEDDMATPEEIWNYQIPINVDSDNPKWTAHYTLRNIEADGDQTQTLVRDVIRMLGKRDGVSADELAAALTPKLTAAVLPLLSHAVTAALGEDNKAQAAAIVDELARQLADGEA